jgi:hypothetical protein
MSILNKYILKSTERKNYTIKYEKWLETGESLSGATTVVSPVTAPPLQVTSIFSPTTNEVTVTVGTGGVDGELYEVEVSITTDQNQIKIDCLQFDIKDDC